MTDEQIVKYWNEIDSEIINEHGEEFDVYITMPAAKSTADLINRQAAEIEKLRERISYLEKSIDCSRKEYNRLLQKLQQAKSEAIKEFAERLCKRRVENDSVVIATKAELDYMLGVGLEVQE